MQEKNEKISGIMADDDNCGSNIDLLIKKLLIEISKESEEDFKKQALQSTTLRLELADEDDHDIDKEITELETLIKRLQTEIVEMSETANKPLPSNCPGFSVIDENSASYTEASYASPEISSQAEPKNDIGFPIISEDDGILEQQIKMFAENISNIINASNNTNPQKDDLDNVRQNFNVLWDNPPKNKSDLTENPEETISSKLSTALNYCILPSSLETKKSTFLNNISIESIKSTNNKAVIEESENVSEFFEGRSPNYTHDDDQKISVDNKLLGNSNDNDDISGSVNEVDTDNIINNVAILLSAESPYNLPGSLVNHPSSTVNTTVPKDTIISLPKLETMEAAKTTIIKPLENVTSSDNSCTADTPEMKQTPSVTRENGIPKTDSILKSLNRKILKIVGRGSEKSISKEKHKSEDVSDKDVLAEFRKAFPRSRSEPSKNVSTPDDDSSINDLTNTTALTQDSPKNVIEGASNTINKNSKTSNIETSNIKAAKTTHEIINIVKKNIPIIPKFVSNDLITDDTDKSKPVTENPSNTTTTSTSLSTESDPSKNYIRANLTTAVYNDMPINTPNGPQTKNIGNLNDVPTPDISKKNLEQDGLSRVTGSIISTIPKFFGSNHQISGQQENALNVEVTTKAEEQAVDKNKVEQDVDKNKVEQDVEAEEDEDYDDDGEKEDYDDDDDDNTYDVD